MTLVQQRFACLDTAVERVHRLFDELESAPCRNGLLDPEVLYRTKLAVHEWIANLVQHADFGGEEPELNFEVSHSGCRLRCVIEDNSKGFCLDRQIEIQTRVHQQKTELPERGMGLLMLHACTEDLSYRRVACNRHRLEFYISGKKDPWLNIRF